MAYDERTRELGGKTMIRRLGILTGGGDVPGLNAIIKTLVWRMEDEGREVVGLRRGWESLIGMQPFDAPGNARYLKELTKATTRRIDRFGGTVLHSSRLNPAMLLPHQLPEHMSADGRASIDATPHVLRVIEHLGLDAVVAVGGDGTLSFARRLHGEGVPVIAVPKTMDNDVHGTDYSIGFSTAVSRAVHFINDLRTAAGSHERILIVELFGRYSGEPCLLASYLAGTDRALIAEVPFDEQRVCELLAADKRASPSNYAVLTVSEGARPIGEGTVEVGEPDAVGHRKLGGIGAVIGDLLRQETGERALYQPLGYLMRSGAPDALDLLVAKNFGNLAADLVVAGKTGLMVAVVGGRYTAVSVERLGEGIRRVNVERFYDSDEYRPKVTSVMNLPMFLH
jgi:ATP-dependent phosphofructokinase / diphosphate-dependent phosphofructokinase